MVVWFTELDKEYDEVCFVRIEFEVSKPNLNVQYTDELMGLLLWARHTHPRLRGSVRVVNGDMSVNNKENLERRLLRVKAKNTSS